MDKRFLILPAIVILVALFSYADDVKRFREGDVVWSCTINGGNATLTSGSADVPAVSGDVPRILIVPAAIRNHRVVGLGNFAFAGLGVEEIQLPKTIVNIGGKAFAYNSQLTRVIFPESLKSIDSSRYTYGSFAGCPNLNELVFLGPPPRIVNFGTSLDGIVRYTLKYKTAWEQYLFENGIEGGALYKPSVLKDDLSLLEQEEYISSTTSATQETETLVSSEKKKIEDESSDKESALQLDALPLTMGADAVSLARVKFAILEFGATIMSLNEKADKERSELDKMTKELLSNEMTRAQQSGELNLTLSLKKIIDEANYSSPSDIPVVSRLQLARKKRIAEIGKKLRSEGVVAARVLFAKVDNGKKIATQEGQFEEAQALLNFSKEVATWAKALSPNVKQPAQATKRSLPETNFKMPIGRMISIKANSAYGTDIGSFRQGDMLIVQYVKGIWTNHGSYYVSPDATPESNYGGMVIYHEENRSIMKTLGDRPSDRASCQNDVSAVPTDTEHFPFAYEVQKTGKYFLRMNDNSVIVDNAGTVVYKVTSIPSVQVGAFKASEEAGKCQWE